MNKMRRELGMFTALLVMCIVLFMSNSSFLGHSNIINVSRNIAMLGIFTIGSGIVIITAGIDLSVGSLIGLTGVLIAKFSSHEQSCFGWPLWVGITLALLIAVFIGLVQGLLITRLKLQPFIVTLGGMLLLRGVSQTIVQGGTFGFGNSNFYNLANNGLFGPTPDNPWVPYPVLIFLLVAVVAAYVLHFTVYGRYIYAIGGNRAAAQYSGINVKRVETSVYMISAFTAGIAGVCYAAYIGQMSQEVGIAYELYAIAGAVLGGCSLMGGEGTVFGMMIGAGIMKVIDNGINMYQYKYVSSSGEHRIFRLDPNWNNIIIGAVILVAVILDQVAHIVQAGRRTRKMADAAAPPSGTGVSHVPSGTGVPHVNPVSDE